MSEPKRYEEMDDGEKRQSILDELNGPKFQAELQEEINRNRKIFGLPTIEEQAAEEERRKEQVYYRERNHIPVCLNCRYSVKGGNGLYCIRSGKHEFDCHPLGYCCYYKREPAREPKTSHSEVNEILDWGCSQFGGA